MLYWKIAVAFGLISLAGSMVSMIVSGDYGPNRLEGILQRVGLSFVAGCAWPLSFILFAALSVNLLCAKMKNMSE